MATETIQNKHKLAKGQNNEMVPTVSGFYRPVSNEKYILVAECQSFVVIRNIEKNRTFARTNLNTYHHWTGPVKGSMMPMRMCVLLIPCPNTRGRVHISHSSKPLPIGCVLQNKYLWNRKNYNTTPFDQGLEFRRVFQKQLFGVFPNWTPFRFILLYSAVQDTYLREVAVTVFF